MNCHEGEEVSYSSIKMTRERDSQIHFLMTENDTNRRHIHLQSLQSLFQVNFHDGSFLGFAEREVAVEDRPAEGEGVHIFGTGSIDCAFAG